MTANKWGNRIIYQIYPRSFKDSNSDGIGDLKGITQKLDYLKDLGIDALWLSPVYKSPMRDFGYDISDFYDIDPIFGNHSEFVELIKETHQRGMKILTDLVPNHTSDEHPWFKESRFSRKNPKRDWYIWRKSKKDGGVPNNWLSTFGGSAWELDKITGEYYLHSFDVSQPDLNWRNPEVVAEIIRVMRYWLSKGVDGFRVDVAYHLFKDPFFRDEPVNTGYTKTHKEYDSLHHIYTTALPETLKMLRKINRVVNEYEDRFMVCEIYTFLNELVNLYKIVGSKSFAPFNFSFISISWNSVEHKKFIDEFDRQVGPNYFPTYVLGNHDQPRVATRLGVYSAKTAALLQLTLRGIPFIYYGEELGMQNVDIPEEKVKDPMAINMKGLGFGRDPERTPMQWNTAKFGGFSDVEPWLPLEKYYKKNNVEVQTDDSKSYLNLYKTIIKLRKSRISLEFGKHIPVSFDNPSIFGFIRQKNAEKTLVLANFSEEVQVVNLPNGNWRTILSTNMDVDQRKEMIVIKLRPSEGIMLDYEY